MKIINLNHTRGCPINRIERRIGTRISPGANPGYLIGVGGDYFIL